MFLNKRHEKYTRNTMHVREKRKGIQSLYKGLI